MQNMLTLRSRDVIDTEQAMPNYDVLVRVVDGAQESSLAQRAHWVMRPPG